MFRTHKITATSSFHSERKLPFDASTTVDELADLQLKQLRKQRLALEGWDRVSMDMYSLNLALSLSSHYHIGEEDIGHILRCCVTDMSNKTIFSFDTLPVAERFPPSSLSHSARLRLSSSVDLASSALRRDGHRGHNHLLQHARRRVLPARSLRQLPALGLGMGISTRSAHAPTQLPK